MRDIQSKALGAMIDARIAEARRDPDAEALLQVLSEELMQKVNVVIQYQSELKFTRENDSPDEKTCCSECGMIMDTPERGVVAVCAPCQMALDYRSWSNK